jgi:hypothetical protein
MKRIAILIIGLLSVFSLKIYGQNDEALTEFKFFRAGMYGTTGITWMKPDMKEWSNDGVRFGYGYGFMAEFALAPNIVIASGFDVMYGSGKMKLSDTLFSYDNMTDKLSNINSIYKIQYLQIPITLKMRTNEINYFRYYMRVGGSLGLRIGTKYTEEISAQDNSFIFRTYDNEKANNRISLFRATFDIGAGIEYSLGGTTALLAEIYFNNGLTNSLKEYNNFKFNAKVNYLMLRVGILF